MSLQVTIAQDISLPPLWTINRKWGHIKGSSKTFSYPSISTGMPEDTYRSEDYEKKVNML